MTKLAAAQTALPEYEWRMTGDGPVAIHGQVALSTNWSDDAPRAVRIHWPKQRHGSSAATSDIRISGTGATLREAHDAAWVNFAKGCAGINDIFGGSDAETPTEAKRAVRRG